MVPPPGPAAKRLAIIIGVASAASAILPAVANHVAGPSGLACGTHVDQDLVLVHDIGPCEGDGLLITASGTYDPYTGSCSNYLTVDLAGFDIYGTVASDDGAGIRMGEPNDGTINGAAFNGKRCVKVTNTAYSSTVTAPGASTPTSEVYDFQACVAINAGSYNLVEKIHCRSSGDDGSSFALYGEGISISDSSHNEVTNLFIGTSSTNVKYCDLADSIGDPPVPNSYNGDGSPKDCGAIPGAVGPLGAITIKGSSTNNTVRHNVIRNNYRCFNAGTGSCQSDGVRLEGDGVDNNLIEKNLITGGALDGIALVIGPDGNTIKDNVVESNGFHHRPHRKGDGIRVLNWYGGNNNTITGNRVCGNRAYGIGVDAGNTGNSVNSNKVGDGSTADPINGGTLVPCVANGLLP